MSIIKCQKVCEENSLSNLSNNGHSENMKLQLGIKEHMSIVLGPRALTFRFGRLAVSNLFSI